jgi:anti-sigma-K factor RskA
MSDDLNEELAALYALDLLEGAEKAAFEAELARNPALRHRKDELRTAAADLARLAPPAEPPPELKARILSSVAARSAAPAASRAHRAPVLPFASLIPWAIAACLAVGVLWTARLTLTLHSENALMRNQQQLAELDLRALRNGVEAERLVRQHELEEAQRALADASRQVNESRQQLAQLRQDVDSARQKFADATRQAADAGRQIALLSQKLKQEGDLAQYKIATLASMLGNSPQALAVVVWNPMEQEGMLKLAKLAMPASDKDYQLWVIDPQYKDPVSAGLVAMDSATGEAHVMFKTVKPIKTVAKFAISLEQKGGMPEPQGPIVMLSE